MDTDDGKCVVDVVHDAHHNGDSASFHEIRNAAGKVMKWCIDAPRVPSEGGYVGRIGTWLYEQCHSFSEG